MLNSDLKAAAIGPNTEGVPAGFFVAHLPPPTSIDLTAIDDDVYSNVAHASAPRDHVLLVQHSSLQLVLQNICNVEAMSWNGLMEISDTANFQRARYLLQALIPQFVNPFGTMSVSSDRQISTVPIGGLTHFPNYYILVYKLFEINKVLSAQSVRPERVYIQLGSFDSLGLRSVSNEQCREELFRGSRVEPAPFLSSNPFDEEIKSDRYIGDDSIPDLIDMSTDTTSNNGKFCF